MKTINKKMNLVKIRLKLLKTIISQMKKKKNKKLRKLKLKFK